MQTDEDKGKGSEMAEVGLKEGRMRKSGSTPSGRASFCFCHPPFVSYGSNRLLKLTRLILLQK